MKNYSELLKDPRWQKKRLEIMQRDGWKCLNCQADNKQLHVHHLYYDYDLYPWEYPDRAYITLCDSCHEEEHSDTELKFLINEYYKLGFHKYLFNAMLRDILSEMVGSDFNIFSLLGDEKRAKMLVDYKKPLDEFIEF